MSIISFVWHFLAGENSWAAGAHNSWGSVPRYEKVIKQSKGTGFYYLSINVSAAFIFLTILLFTMLTDLESKFLMS